MPEQQKILSSWKEIATYLRRTERTCQRLERGMGLPVHRLDGSPKARVFAYPHELDAWLAQKIDEHKADRKGRRLLPYLAMGAMAVAAVVAVFLIVLKPAPDEMSIAVLVHDLNLEPGQEHLPDCIAEAVRCSLWKIKGLQVTGKISSDAARDRKLDDREAGRLLGVRNILNLGVQVADGNIRITAQLVNPQDGYVRWGDIYDRPARNIFAIEDELTRAIVGQLKVALESGERAVSIGPPTQDIEAYSLYQKGRFLLGRPRPETPGAALGYFRQALERDPDFALAYTGMAWVYMNMISQYLARPNDVGPKAESAVKRALDLDPDLAEAHALSAWVQFVYRNDWAATESSFRKALDLRPGDAMTRGMYAFYLFTRKRYQEARSEIKRSLAADPFMPVLSSYSMWIHLYSGEGEEVLEEFRKVQMFEPDYEFSHFAAGLAYLRKGRIDESIELFTKACALLHTNGRPEAGLAVASLKKGDRKEAGIRYTELLKEREKTGCISAINLAWIRAEMGDVEAACDWVETAIRDHDPMVPSVHIYAESMVPRLARSPRFLAILDRLHLPH
jgi:adenylate cyclase